MQERERKYSSREPGQYREKRKKEFRRSLDGKR
jgi:hypothetical protein